MSVSKGIEILALKLCSEMDELGKLEEQVKEKKKIINKIKSQDLAEMVDTEGYQVGSKIMLQNGKTILVKEFMSCSLPSLTNISKEKDPEKQIVMQDRRTAGFKWLEDNGKGDAIKHTVTASFKREEGDKAKSLEMWLIEKEVSATRDENVHAGTLKSVLTEAMGNGEAVPMDVFGIYRGVVVDVK